MLHARRQLVPLLAAAAMAVTSCQTIKLTVVNISLLGRSTYNGNDRLDYIADLRNDSTTDIKGAWAQVSGGVPAGATLLDDILLFGPTPASGTSRSYDLFSVIVPPGAAFDPTVLTWTTHAGVHDFDLDGLTEGQERDDEFRTDPTNPDTDGDGVGDGIEAMVTATDPLDAQSAPDAFPDGIFYSSGPRPDGGTAIAVAGAYSSAPGYPILVGPGAPGPFGPAFDRNGFLYVARGGDVAHLDALTGQLLGSVSLHDLSGNPVQATQLAYDPSTDTFVGVKNDPATGAPTPQLLHVDVHTGLATEFGSPLPGAPLAITIRPEIDSSNGTRWLYAVIADASGTQQIYKVELGTFAATPVGSSLTTQVTGLAFDKDLNLVEAVSLGDGTYSVNGSPFPYGPFYVALHGLALPQPCPAPCFAPAVYRGVSANGIAVGDIDGDGDPDVVVAGSNYPSGAGLDWYANDGSGNLVAQPATTTTYSMASVALADFDGDGHLDAALIDDDTYSLQWARGHGSGAFDPPVQLGASAFPPVRAGDVTGDGAPDIVDSEVVMVNDGTGTFMPYQSAFGNANSVAIANLDSGPVRQIVAVYGNGTSIPDEVATFVWNGSLAGFVETSRQPLDFWPYYVTAGDLDGDGFDDVVVTGFEPGTNTAAVATLRAAGDGSLQAPVRLAGVPSMIHSGAVIADMSGDGRPDIILGSCTDPQKTLRLLVGDGAGHFQPAPFGFFSGNCDEDLATADLDGDGRRDLISSFSLSTALQLPVYPVK